MRLRRRSGHDRNDRTAKGECRHVWRVRDLSGALSGATCEVCEGCGAMHVAKTAQPIASAAAMLPATALDTAASRTRRTGSLPTSCSSCLSPIR